MKSRFPTMFLLLAMSSWGCTCTPQYREPPVHSPRTDSTADSRAREQEIAICENRVQETMKDFHLKNPDDNEANRTAESGLYEREQSVCNRLRDSYGLQANPNEGSWGANAPYAPGYSGYDNHMARDMLTGAAIGAGATYLLNRNRRQAPYNTNDPRYYDRNQTNRYSNNGYDDTRYRDDRRYNKPAPNYRPSKPVYSRSRGVFRGRRR